MPQPFRTTRRVEFHETDAAGIMHFASFFLYMEEAEHALLRSVGLSVMMRDCEHDISWPRVAARCDYQSSVRFEDVLDIDVRLTRLGSKSVTYEFIFTLGGRPVAVGEMTSVCCQFDSGKPRSVPIPDAIAEKLRGFQRE